VPCGEAPGLPSAGERERRKKGSPINRTVWGAQQGPTPQREGGRAGPGEGPRARGGHRPPPAPPLALDLRELDAGGPLSGPPCFGTGTEPSVASAVRSGLSPVRPGVNGWIGQGLPLTGDALPHQHVLLGGQLFRLTGAVAGLRGASYSCSRRPIPRLSFPRSRSRRASMICGAIGRKNPPE